MHTNIQYINLSWAVVGVCETPAMPLWKIIPTWCKDMADGIHHYIVGYLAFWHVAFIDESRLLPCHDENLREKARRKIDRYIADHQPVETLPRFYLVMLRQQIAPMESDGLSRVYQV